DPHRDRPLQRGSLSWRAANADSGRSAPVPVDRDRYGAGRGGNHGPGAQRPGARGVLQLAGARDRGGIWCGLDAIARDARSGIQPPLRAADGEWFSVRGGSNQQARGEGFLRHLSAIVISLVCAAGAHAQGNYEVQVYGSDLIPKGVTMVELHTNFTVSGTKGVVDGVLPTHHALHETLEITHGWNEWFETGLYQFTSLQSDGSWQWAGSPI